MPKHSGLFTLLYGGEVVAWSSDFYVLLEEKAELIFNRAVRYPELLEIHYKGFRDIFDKNFDYETAMLYLVWVKVRYPFAIKQYTAYQNRIK